MAAGITDGVTTQNAYQTTAAESVKGTKETAKTKGEYGKTFGKPELSKEAAEYYKELKKKYSNMEFVLVGRDQKEFAKAQAGRFANPNKMVVLIDEDKIERMAKDENFRRQYEGIIENASAKVGQLKNSLQSMGVEVKGFGMQVNDGGTGSLFAVLKKSSSEQKARIEQKQAQKKEHKKVEEKKAEKKKVKERIEARRAEKKESEAVDDEDTIVILAESLEQLLQKISDFAQNERMNAVQTEQEQSVGQHIDFRG